MQKVEIGEIVFGEGIPKICTPLTSTGINDLLEECSFIRETEADLVEWRVDFFDDALDTERVLAALPKLRERLGDIPILFSFRTSEEGGEKTIPVEQYISLNKAVAESGYINIIDIELFRGKHVVEELISIAKANGVFTVVSNHDFEQTPALDELVRRITEAFELGADFPKIAVMPRKEEDVLTLLEASLQVKRTYPNRALIMIAMGSLGVISRIGGEVFGSAVTFASARKASAPGQISVDKMKSILQLIHDAK